MLAGPVFHFELVRIARRRSFYALRLGFGVILLGVVALNYWGHFGLERAWSEQRELSLGEIARFGAILSTTLMSAQAVMVLGLTPALVADAIASERHRKTLPYLMASRLNSVEIVVGKLGARLLHVGAFLLLVLPVASLLTLFGGVSPEELVWFYGSLASTAYFLAALAMLASVLTRRPREAVGAATALTVGWIVLPPLFDSLLSAPSPSWAAVAESLRMVNAWLLPASPSALVSDTRSILFGGPGELGRRLTWMIGSQLVYGTAFLVLAAWQLRPAFRRHEGRSSRPSRAARLTRRWFPVPPCGDDPVYWREAHFAASGAGLIYRIALVVVVLLLVGSIVATIYGSRDAFLELSRNGFVYDEQNYQARLGFNLGLRVGGSLLFGLWMLGLGVDMAGKIVSEREQDTWVSLLATPLEGPEILQGKIRAALRGSAPFAVTLLAIWLIGLAAGAVHPLGLILAGASSALFTWFVAALGLFISLKSQTVWRARALTLGILIAPQVCCLTPIPSLLTLMGISLLSYMEVNAFLFNPKQWGSESGSIWMVAAYVFGGYAMYGGAAYGLTRSAFRKFDVVVDRPRRAATGPIVLAEVVATPPKKKPGAAIPEEWEADEGP